MAKKRVNSSRAIDRSVAEDDILDKIANAFDDDGDPVAIADGPDGGGDVGERGEGGTPPAPRPGDPGFHDHALSLLEPHERDDAGRPRYHGLRRLAELFLGPIVSNVATIVEAPTKNNGFHATAQALIAIDTERGVVTVGDVADCFHGNTDAYYGRHAAATAATKARARALREALRLRGIAADEATTVPVEEAGLDGLITPAQVRALGKAARDLDVDVLALANAMRDGSTGRRASFATGRSISYDHFQRMFEKLSEFLQDESRIPDAIRGYRDDWAGG